MSTLEPGSYLIPELDDDSVFEFETEVKKSRFITFLKKAHSRADALKLQNELRAAYPDASHHCLAFVAGPPEGNTSIGFDDDGEPGGTAGKPMLNVLQHKKIGEVVAVVVRYFGGTKLGAGGLVRAYGSAVQAAVDHLPVMERIAMIEGQLQTAYQNEQAIRHILGVLAGNIVDCQYTDNVMLEWALPKSHKLDFQSRVTESCKGQVTFKWSDK
ncbi:YigZ family protein [Endozoicomonas sp. OPT23]|uniref:YigZ family protein n=1 Tax=Endozoicomonas sp. OPT23 TaxID=2072845 RepID=UPI00129BB82C|nr:YigZ family protein [Endozoicomonas sp. OPT23]MRI33795.1 YigZ family protein [Endozoicomonas sp. OPT23]